MTKSSDYSHSEGQTRPDLTKAPVASGGPSPDPSGEALAPEIVTEIAPNDPIIAYLQTARGAVDLTHLDLDSPALEELRARGVALVVPLVTSGELVGILNVGPRLSEQGYSADDRRLLETLAAHAAPAMRVGQLIREQQAEMRERGRMEQELQVAQMIQKNFLPRSTPDLAGWLVAADYRPARAVGGDFYDFIDLDGGQVGLVIGDVTDKGIPAAMVMAATKGLLRASAQRLVDPGAVLGRVNDQLCPEIPENMFVTCFYGVLDPTSGALRYANAGHNLPIVDAGGESSELRATGMPLGLMPHSQYEQQETTLAAGSCVLFYSDGLVEAHDRRREMFGTARAAKLLTDARSAAEVLRRALAALDDFSGDTEEQEDDITLVALMREQAAVNADLQVNHGGRRVLADFTVASAAGNERGAIKQLAAALAPVGLPAARLERLKTATAEATMNAMEHGNRYDPALDVRVAVLASDSEVAVRISDHGDPAVIVPPETPDIDAKLEGVQSPRGWGLFLIKEMVDDLRETSEGGEHVVELVMDTQGAENDTSNP